jgi:hypothetical protein
MAFCLSPNSTCVAMVNSAGALGIYHLGPLPLHHLERDQEGASYVQRSLPVFPPMRQRADVATRVVWGWGLSRSGGAVRGGHVGAVAGAPVRLVGHPRVAQPRAVHARYTARSWSWRPFSFSRSYDTDVYLLPTTFPPLQR